MILVTGATGSVGGALVSRLSTSGTPARALVRSRERGDNLRGFDVDLAVGTYEDEGSLRAALEGVDAVFLLTPPGPPMAEQEKAVIRAARDVCPQARVVKLAAVGVDSPSPSPVRMVRQHQEVVQVLRDSGLPHTVLAPGSFMQNLLRQAATVQERGVVASALGDAALSWVDVRDVAAVAEHVLTSDGHEGATYTLTGPQALTFDDVAAALARVLDREVVHQRVSPEDARSALLAAGVPEWLADGLRELDEVVVSGACATVTDEVQRATGRPARTLQEFLTEHRAAFL